MTSATHVLAATITALTLNLPIIPTVFGAILPDIDLKLGLQKFRQERGLFRSHRGITHHAVLIPIFFILGIFAKDFLGKPLGDYILSFSMGYISHLALDTFNPLGIPYSFGYYPRFSLKLVKTGGKGEIFAILLLVAVLTYLLNGKELSPALFIGDETSKFWINLLGGLLNEVLH